MTSLRVEFEIPTLLASQAGLNIQNINQDVRLMFALFLYEHRRVSLGKACELGGINQWEFADLNRQLGIPGQYSNQDLSEDLERLANA